MKNKNDLKQVVKFQGEFDVSHILKSLEAIQSQMTKTSAGKTFAGNIQNQINSIVTKASKLQVILGQGFTNTASISKAKAQYQELVTQMRIVEKQAKKINLSTNQVNGAMAVNLRGADVEKYSRLTKELTAARLELGKFEREKKKIFDATQLGVSQNFTKELSGALQGDKKGFKQVFDNEFKRVQEKYTRKTGFDLNVGAQNDTKTHQRLEKIRKSLEEIKKLSENAFKDIDAGGDVETIRTKLVSEANQRGFSFDSDATVDQVRKKIDLAVEGENRLTNLSNRRGEIENIRNTALQRQASLTTRISTLTADTNNILLQGTRDLQEEIRTSGSEVGAQIDSTVTSMNGLFRETENVVSSQQKFEKAFDNMKERIVLIFSLKTAMEGVRKVVTDTYRSITELDKRLASIAMVTDYSLSEMWGQYNAYSSMAQELGQKTKDVISSSALFMQQGLDLNQAFSLTTETMRLATLEGGGFEQATSEMTAALRGFRMEMTEGQRVTDVYSELAAKAAADVQGIAYAISKSASIADSAEMSFENTSAFITKMIETTQEAPRTATFLYS